MGLIAMAIPAKLRGIGLNMTDPIVDAVRQKLLDRSQVGIQKYGTTMERDDLSRLDWLRLFQEELLDGAVYMERIIQDEQNA